MNIELSELEYRRLLDIVYIGNWILNSTRASDRIEDYDHLQSKIFSYCGGLDMNGLFEKLGSEFLPSAAFENGGIHEAIADYEDTVFFEILAEELAKRDMAREAIGPENFIELTRRVDEYIDEFERNGMENITLTK